MATVLFVKGNPRTKEESVSVKMYEEFLSTYKQENPEDEIVELDLYAENLPYLNADMLNGLFKPLQQIATTPEEDAARETSDRYLEQFIDADKVVFAFPLWNFTIPAALHTYIDYLSRAGKTFKYTPEGPLGLMGDKKVALLNARGGIYSNGPTAQLEMSMNYMRNVMGFWGVEQLSTVVIEGHNQMPDQAETIIADGLEEVRKTAKAF
ncbi:FMN-dependent NADH-azoreductase [Alkalihalophilus lindianensis]|uniref:FMN dependent NADH:quinone oxidoreductase n=1 Tax=Alkalihalophilus lindianensis TaxID=1630542 RepID=A0ABU3X9P4_9BACI|nr:FMN-dependent NADH-azoreductase [Alkalihalophilus lindianensis]MDV2684609.1 FMN-dependent NADH-azoreductase [Alkalihalophilus lindianensis]